MNRRSVSHRVRAFTVWIRGSEHRSTVNAASGGQAKMEYLRDLDGCVPDVKFTDLRCAVAGPAHSSEQFLRNANYRGLPRLRCGDRVSVSGNLGTVVGHNASANFEVLFDPDAPKYPRLRLSVHPSDLDSLETKEAA